ncbi:MAG: PAS domain-containing sensor histidine kinase [Anaerolineaceae bacterium]|nr:MAG: PAS domain-containing sensor histidine kinase [Anaerolineaceae bacterium]
MKSHNMTDTLKISQQSARRLQDYAQQAGQSPDALLAQLLDDYNRQSRESRAPSLREQMLDAVQQAIMATDATGRIIYWNRFAETLYGWSHDEAIGRPVMEVTPTEATLEQANEIMAALSEGRAWSGEMLLRRKDGSQFEARFYDYPILADDGRIVGIIGISYDITAEKQAEDSLRRSEARLRSIVETQSAYVVRTDIVNIHYTYANQRFIDHYGWMYTDDEPLVGSSPTCTVIPEDHPLMIDTARRCIKNPDQPFQVTLRKPARDGGVGHVLWEFVALTDADGDVNEIQCIGIDITAQKQADEMRVEQAGLRGRLQKEKELNSLIQRAISSLAHDIRTPLAIIKTSRDLLGRYFDRMDESQRRQRLNQIDRQLLHVTHMMDDLAVAVRSGLSERRFTPTPICIVTLCRLCLQEMQAVSTNPPPMKFINHTQLEKIHADETLVMRVLLNLLSNAVKYTPPDGAVALILDEADDWCIIRVQDSGIGIKPDDLSRVFEPFFRVDEATVQDVQGTGLGLSIVKDCVDLHGGHIQIESEPHQGTLVMVMLPIAP